MQSGRRLLDFRALTRMLLNAPGTSTSKFSDLEQTFIYPMLFKKSWLSWSRKFSMCRKHLNWTLPAEKWTSGKLAIPVVEESPTNCWNFYEKAQERWEPVANYTGGLLLTRFENCWWAPAAPPVFMWLAGPFEPLAYTSTGHLNNLYVCTHHPKLLFQLAVRRLVNSPLLSAVRPGKSFVQQSLP